MSNGGLGRGGKRAVSRHTTESRATAGRLERGIERLTRREGKREIAEAQAQERPSPKKWKFVQPVDYLVPGDKVRHYEELTGDPKTTQRKVRGWSEVGVVVQTMDLVGFPGTQDCLIAFVGESDDDFHPKSFDGARPYILRYYNTSVVKL